MAAVSNGERRGAATWRVIALYELVVGRQSLKPDGQHMGGRPGVRPALVEANGSDPVGAVSREGLRYQVARFDPFDLSGSSFTTESSMSIPSAWDDGQPRWKQRGQAVLEKLERKKVTKAAEEAEKRKVRQRDRTCRWPHCKPETRLECAHVVSKGAGGDHGIRSTADQMVLLCYLCHQGPTSLHSGDRRVEPLTPEGTNGPCAFWQTDDHGQEFMVAQEVQPFIYERD